MAKKKRKSLTMAPFPVLEWNDYSWEATVRLTAWAGFQDRSGAYASQGTAKDSDGTVRLTVDVPFDKKETDPTPAQAAAYLHLTKNQKLIQKTILLEVFAEYPNYRASYIADYVPANPLVSARHSETVSDWPGWDVLIGRIPYSVN